MRVMLPESDAVTAPAQCKHAPDLDTACTKQLTYTEVEEMCTYLEINASREPLLIPLAKMCLVTPLPRGWAIYKVLRSPEAPCSYSLHSEPFHPFPVSRVHLSVHSAACVAWLYLCASALSSPFELAF